MNYYWIISIWSVVRWDHQHLRIFWTWDCKCVGFSLHKLGYHCKTVFPPHLPPRSLIQRPNPRPKSGHADHTWKAWLYCQIALRGGRAPTTEYRAFTSDECCHWFFYKFFMRFLTTRDDSDLSETMFQKISQNTRRHVPNISPPQPERPAKAHIGSRL